MRSLVTLCALLALGCASEPEAASSGPPATERLVVDLLDGDFVRFDAERMPVEEFVYELRRRCRAVDLDPDRMPWIQVRVPRSGRVTPSPRTLDTIRAGAYDLGVQHIDMTFSDGEGA